MGDSQFQGQRDWSKGSNNLAPTSNIPQGYARELVNVDATPTGQLSLRADYTLAATLNNARAAVATPTGLLIADGTALVAFDGQTNSTHVLRQIAGAGQLVGATLNGDVFLCTSNESLLVRDGAVHPWGVDPVAFQPQVVSAGLKGGLYRVAVTSVNSLGVESGALPTLMTLTANSGLRVNYMLPVGAVTARLYVSQPDGQTLFLQDERPTGALVCANLRDDTQRLTTENLLRPPLGSQVEAHQGRLLIVAGAVVYFTEPFMPHHFNRLSGFIQYPEAVSVVKSVGDMVFVVADKTYCVTALGTPNQQQAIKLAVGGIPGSGVSLPDGSAAWMTRYGQAIAGLDGTVALPNRTSYAPHVAERATAGVVEYNGNQQIVTAMRGRIQGNGLGIRDNYGWEVV